MSDTGETSLFNSKRFMGDSASDTLVDLSDLLANEGAVLSFSYEAKENYNVQFKAFITGYNETYTSESSVEQVFGRIDPVHMFRQTTRNITLSFVMPASSRSEAYENLYRLDKLRSMLYPTYVYNVERAFDEETEIYANRTDYSATIAQSPLVRIKVLNLLTGGVRNSDRKSYLDLFYRGEFGNARPGALCAIRSLNVNHNLENTDSNSFAGINSDGTHNFNHILPQLIEVSLEFMVIHEQHLGHMSDGTAGAVVYGLDYDASLSDAMSFQRRQLAMAQGISASDLIRAGAEGPELQAITDAALAELSGYMNDSQLSADRSSLRHQEIQAGSQYGFDSQQALSLQGQIQDIDDELSRRSSIRAALSDNEARAGWVHDQALEGAE
jgi:hypothetical protein